MSGRTAKTTNLPWTLDADELESVLNIPRVRLINDFQSVGYGIEALQADDIVTLQAGREVPHGPRVVIGAGTGLGHGFLVWQDDHYEVIASEGGHVDFAPTNPLQDELLQYLRGRFGQVSWERVVSGSGLVNLFDFLLATNKGTETAALHATRCTEDPAAAISRFALEGKDALALQALNLFTNLYGAQTGNMALMGLASGGVYVAGGVAPKIIDKIKEGIFMQSFLNKEARIRPVLEAMPVRVVTNAHVGLMGSALVAARLAASSI